MAGIGSALSAPLLILNLILYIITAALAGWILNNNIDYTLNLGGTKKLLFIGNYITNFFVPLALISSVVGLASVFTGIHHLRIWRSESLSAATGVSLVAWLLTLLSLGLASKEIHTGYLTHDFRSERLKTLEAFIVISSFFELLYLLTLHAGLFSEDLAPAGTKAVPSGV